MTEGFMAKRKSMQANMIKVFFLNARIMRTKEQLIYKENIEMLVIFTRVTLE